MRKLKEMLRLRYDLGYSCRAIGRSLSVAHSTVGDVLSRFEAEGLSYPLPQDMDEAMLEARLYPGNTGKKRQRPEPEWDMVHQELRKKSVTLQLLWLEYRERHPDGYQYSQFCERYRKWRGKLDVVMRQQHRAGEKMFVDWAGHSIPLVDAKTGATRPAYIFVAVLGASSYTYVQACPALDLKSWIGAHCRAVEFFRGVPEIVIPDNLKAGVKAPDRYEPDLNPTYLEWAQHYNTVVIPTRPARPRDKAKVESAVGVVSRWILARLRQRTMFSLAELNEAIHELLPLLNDRPFQKLTGSRRSLFETLDRPALGPLPANRYEFATFKRCRVSLDYHVQVDHNFYSVPHSLVHQEVEARITADAVEILHRGHRVASHLRITDRSRCSTQVAHMPKAHQRYLGRKPSSLIEEANQIGPQTAQLVQTILTKRPHPEQGYRSCLGVLQLARHYGTNRMEAAAERALLSGIYSYQRVRSILDQGLDRIPLQPRPQPLPVFHEHVRGQTYFSSEEGV